MDFKLCNYFKILQQTNNWSTISPCWVSVGECVGWGERILAVLRHRGTWYCKMANWTNNKQDLTLMLSPAIFVPLFSFHWRPFIVYLLLATTVVNRRIYTSIHPSDVSIVAMQHENKKLLRNYYYFPINFFFCICVERADDALCVACQPDLSRLSRCLFCSVVIFLQFGEKNSL